VQVAVYLDFDLRVFVGFADLAGAAFDLGRAAVILAASCFLRSWIMVRWVVRGRVRMF
jgi:hypothetical protein